MNVLKLTLSAVCDLCATTIQRAPAVPVTYEQGRAMLRVESWRLMQRVCGHNGAGVRFVVMLEEGQE